MTGGELFVSWYTVLVCFRVFLLSGDLPWHLWDKCRDQYSCDKLEEMQGDTILGQSAHLNFRISCMAAPMECWMVLEEVYCVVWEKCKYAGGVPLFVRGNEGRIYERGLFNFRDRLIKYMITWKSH